MFDRKFLEYTLNINNKFIPLKINGKVIKVLQLDTTEKRQLGLQYFKKLEEDEGALFIYDKYTNDAFHMKGVPFDIQIAFIDKDFKVVDLKYMKANSPDFVFSHEPYFYALEMNAGWFDRNHIKIGDKLDIEGIAEYPREFILESDNMENKYGCIMLQVPIKNWETILTAVHDEDTYTGKGSHGKEHHPHITVIYGLDVVNYFGVKKYLLERVTQPLKFRIKGLNIFKKDDYDVLYFEIESQDLQKLHKDIAEEFIVHELYDTYTPHMTLAYLKKGAADKYLANFKDNNFVMSSKKFEISLPSGDSMTVNTVTSAGLTGYSSPEGKPIYKKGENFLFEYVVPQNMSLKEWLQYRKKHNISAREYHNQNPKLKWKVVHGHKKGAIGKPINKKASNLTYEEAIKMHTAVVLNEKSITMEI